MAESDHGIPTWGSGSTSSTVTQGWDSAPHLNARAPPFAHHHPNSPLHPHNVNSSYNDFGGDLPMFQHPHVLHAPLGHETYERSPYPDENQQRHVYQHPPPGAYNTHPRPPSAFRRGPYGARADMSDWFDGGDSAPRSDYPMMHGGPGFAPPCPHMYNNSWSPQTPGSSFAREGSNGAANFRPPASYGWQGFLPMPDNRNSDRQRLANIHNHNHRSFQPEALPQINRSHDDERRAQRRALMLQHAQNQRSERSISPLYSARRNYDHFSYDVQPSSTSSGVEEAAARVPPSNRARRIPRQPRLRFHPRHANHDPNMATPQQIQELKGKLPRRLPSQLPDLVSGTCDICSKDYSSTHVQPSEDEEIAIELPCGHCFGEFCIFQWFDTCRTHKNKVTCPMCRKQLIEPSRYPHAMLEAMSRAGGPAFQELLANELRGDFGHV